jgi:Tfp pilus assembly PilM family ATPase
MFRPRTTGWIGFDLGDATVKAAQVVRAGNEFRIATAAIVPRRDRWDADALTADQPLSSADELAAAASICDGLSGRSAAAVLPMSLCDAVQVAASSTRRGSSEEFAAQVEAELHQSLDGYVIASWPAALQQEKLNVVTVPAAWSDSISDDVAASRWNCRRIDPLPWALARAIVMADPAAATRTIAALDWGYARATFTLVHQGAPALVRCLKDCGFQQTIAAVESQLRLSTPDAERVLQRYGLDDAGAGTAGVLASALTASLQRLEAEVRRTLGYWQGQTRGVRPDSLVLFGGGASLSGLSQRLATSLEVPVSPWTLPPARPEDAERLPPAHLLGPALAASALAWEATWPSA